MVASKQLRLAVEMEEEKRASLKNDAATKRLRLAIETDKKESKTGEVVDTTQLSLALVTEEERRAKKNGFDFDVI